MRLSIFDCVALCGFLVAVGGLAGFSWKAALIVGGGTIASVALWLESAIHQADEKKNKRGKP
jgi:hypothetical protein